MSSVNFEFLRDRWPELAGLGGFAEQYARPDPTIAAVKLRQYAEQLVEFVWHHDRLPRLFQANLNDRLNNDSFKQAVPRVIVTKLHALRRHGNKAAHGETLTSRTAAWLLKEAFDLGAWLHLAYNRGTRDSLPQFREPAVPADTKAALKREKKAVLEKLAAQEAEMQLLLSELDAERSRADQAEATAAELQATLQVSENAVSVLEFDEWTTRKRLIDEALVSGGWDVGSGGSDTATVKQEYEVPDQPTDSGIGYADYVLFDDTEQPLAVIEAKKTARDAQEGQTQAQLYADGIEKKHGRRPMIFFTNGYETWLWNDVAQAPPRKVYGFYSRDSLEYTIYQRQNRKPPQEVQPDPQIAGRMYQIEAVKRVVERFATKHRKALIVQATGTGKTRVAISLSAALVRANWAKRILFLCDRRELRKQAHNAFKQFLPGEPRVYVTADTWQDRDKRIYFATYPAMMKCYESFDVGFFDLIIADESHRSIYNRYRDLLHYFDGYLVGLTATPRRELIGRNTYKLFGCEDGDPTAYFSYEEAINSTPAYLVPFKPIVVTTPFLRQGIKYSQMTPEQRRELEEDEVLPESIEFEQHQVDKHIFNKDTNRRILRNLMEHGIRDATGSHAGKSIIFARNHNHAVLLQNLFDEMYPQYGGDFCRVIDNYDPRAEELIDDFKGVGTNPELTIAISVDMLDTGIDIPAVVNLVFAKPIFSYIKFWQMIGRGTRLCPNLFGAGEHKTHFTIFDHWGNFEYFDEKGPHVDDVPIAKPLLQRLFEARVALAETAVNKPDEASFNLVVDSIRRDVIDLPDRTIAVRENWKHVDQMRQEHILKQFDAAVKGVLMQDIAPLMQWRAIAGHEEGYKFDLLIAKLQRERLLGSSRFDDLKDELRNEVERLQMNLNPVRAKEQTINEVRSTVFWNDVTVADLERVRTELRGIMQFKQASTTSTLGPKVIDVTEDESLVERREHKPKLAGLDLAAYRGRVERVLRDLFDTNATLQKIQRGELVTDDDLQTLNSLIHTQDPDLDLNDLTEYYPETAGKLDRAIRAIIGLDADAVAQRFSEFVQQHQSLNSQQIRFLDLLQNHIARYGSIELDRLYEAPFTTLHAEGIDGIFADEAQIADIIRIIESFNPQSTEGSQTS